MGVYFVRAEGTPFVKIGKSSNMRRRLAGIQTGCPHKVTVERWIDVAGLYQGRREDIDIERSLHSRLRLYRHIGEWFRLSRRMVDAAAREVEFGQAASLLDHATMVMCREKPQRLVMIEEARAKPFWVHWRMAARFSAERLRGGVDQERATAFLGEI